MQSYLVREHDSLQRLDHPNIVSYLGYDENPDQGTYILYLEFCNAGDLGQYERLPPDVDGNDFLEDESASSSEEHDMILEESEVWHFIFQLAAALAYCHHGFGPHSSGFGFEHDWQCILHRDIKPANGKSTRSSLFDENFRLRSPVSINLQSGGSRIPKLCDLGLSKALVDETQTSLAASSLYAPPVRMTRFT